MFGGDGVRGKANTYPMLPGVVLSLSQAAAHFFSQKDKLHTNRVIIGKDTRLSGYLFEQSVAAGLISMGKEVFFLGPVPTPCLAFLTKSMRADFGIMITASHNPYYDNGLKIFDKEGFKVDSETEKSITALSKQDMTPNLKLSRNIGRAYRLRGVEGRYLQYAKSFFPHSRSLSDLKVVVDCANGAAYKLAPELLYELEAKKIIALGVSPNGTNINEECGSTYISKTEDRVLLSGADVGLAFDGDADRLIMVDEKGQVVDGDIILGVIAKYWKKAGLLKSNKVIGTVASNMGLEQFLAGIGIDLLRVDVGDKNVMTAIKKYNCNLGAEPSGHVILLDRNTNSDGILTCLEMLRIMVETQKPLSELTKEIIKVPQVTSSIDSSRDILHSSEVKHFIDSLQEHHKEKNRILVRKSGTENKIRVLVEGQNMAEIKEIKEEIINFLKKYSTSIDK